MATPAEVAATSNNGYNYYPQIMIKLCEISYQLPSTIPAAVQQLGWQVGWGPAHLPVGSDDPYALPEARIDP